MKTCVRCKQQKSKAEFNKDKRALDCLYCYCRTCDNIELREWCQNNPERHLLSISKDRAREENLPFDLSLEDIRIPEYCPYLNIKLDQVASNSPYAPSVDRIDSTHGYIKGNIQIISVLANRMKNNASVELLLAFSEGIKRVHILKK